MYAHYVTVEEGKIASSTMSLNREEMAFGICIGRIGFLGSSSLYRPVADNISIKRLPNSAPWVSGLLNLYGNQVPVFDLHEVLSEELVDPDNRRLYVIGKGSNLAALWIDGDPEVKRSELFQPVKELSELSLIQQCEGSGSFKQDGQIWFKIDFEELFNALGRDQLLPGEVGD